MSEYLNVFLYTQHLIFTAPLAEDIILPLLWTLAMSATDEFIISACIDV